MGGIGGAPSDRDAASRDTALAFSARRRARVVCPDASDPRPHHRSRARERVACGSRDALRDAGNAQVRDTSAGARRAPYFFFLAVFRVVFRGGTFAPLARASLRPMAMACLRLLTFRPEPLFSVPFLVRRTADSTLFEAARPYFAIVPPHHEACK